MENEKKGFFSKLKEEMDKQQVIQEAKMKERKKQDKKNSKLDAKLEKFYLDDINQETKESLRYATTLFANAGGGLSDLFLPTKHVDSRNNELLRAITTQNYIIIKQNDNVEKQNARIIELLSEISSKLDK
jgi:hypothetical protein